MRRLLAVVGLLISAAANGQQVSDTLVITSPNFAPLSGDSILVTPAGGTQTTLSAALAGGGGSNPTFNSVTVTSGVSAIAPIDLNPNPSISCFICIGPTITYDPSTGGGSGDDRWTGVFSTLSPSQSTADLWENFNSFVYINGPGVMSHEINILHSNGQIFPGGTWHTGEGVEASLFNQGTVSGNYDGVLATTDNQSSSTAVQLTGFHALLKQENLTAAAVGTYYGFFCDTLNGGGSNPTNYYCMLNKDANAQISSAGPLLLGGIGFGAAGALLDIHGSDTSGGTIPLRVENSSLALQFYVTDSGNSFFAQKLSVGSGGTAGFIQMTSTTSGDQILLQAGAGTAANTTNIIIPQGVNTTLAGLALTQTFTATNTFSGTANFSGTLQGAGVAGVTCASITAATVTVSNGIVTHC